MRNLVSLRSTIVPNDIFSPWNINLLSNATARLWTANPSKTQTYPPYASRSLAFSLSTWLHRCTAKSMRQKKEHTLLKKIKKKLLMEGDQMEIWLAENLPDLTVGCPERASIVTTYINSIPPTSLPIRYYPSATDPQTQRNVLCTSVIEHQWT